MLFFVYKLQFVRVNFTEAVLFTTAITYQQLKNSCGFIVILQREKLHVILNLLYFCEYLGLSCIYLSIAVEKISGRTSRHTESDAMARQI